MADKAAKGTGHSGLGNGHSRAKPAHNGSALTEMVDLNTATVADLRQLRGVGPALAERIVQFRVASGGFESPEDLKRVPGISQAIFDANQQRLVAQPPRPALAASGTEPPTVVVEEAPPELTAQPVPSEPASGAAEPVTALPAPNEPASDTENAIGLSEDGPTEAAAQESPPVAETIAHSPAQLAPGPEPEVLAVEAALDIAAGVTELWPSSPPQAPPDRSPMPSASPVDRGLTYPAPLSAPVAAPPAIGPA